MWEIDKEYIPDIIEKHGSNVYAAIRDTAKQARKLCKGTNSMLSESKALSWAITGKKPPEADRVVQRDTYKYALLEDSLSNVDDQSVRDSVHSSYKRSIEVGHLIYCYSDELPSGYENKVRVAVNIAWYLMLANK